jgi:uncharacterized repeat protein (TIGR01451 family)
MYRPTPTPTSLALSTPFWPIPVAMLLNPHSTTTPSSRQRWACSSRAALSATLVSGSNPKALPGATVEYCIAVQNTGSVAATSVAIEDLIPANTTFVTGSILLGATVTDYGLATQSCSAGSAGGSYTTTPSPRVNGTLASVGAASTSGLIFRVTIN